MLIKKQTYERRSEGFLILARSLHFELICFFAYSLDVSTMEEPVKAVIDFHASQTFCDAELRDLDVWIGVPEPDEDDDDEDDDEGDDEEDKEGQEDEEANEDDGGDERADVD